jgi:hypothetical protein
MYPHPAADLAPPALLAGLFLAGLETARISRKHSCVRGGWTQPTHRLGPATSPSVRGAIFCGTLDWRAPPAPTGGAAKGEQQQQKSNFGRRIAQTLLE